MGKAQGLNSLIKNVFDVSDSKVVHSILDTYKAGAKTIDDLGDDGIKALNKDFGSYYGKAGSGRSAEKFVDNKYKSSLSREINDLPNSDYYKNQLSKANKAAEGQGKYLDEDSFLKVKQAEVQSSIDTRVSNAQEYRANKIAEKEKIAEQASQKAKARQDANARPEAEKFEEAQYFNEQINKKDVTSEMTKKKMKNGDYSSQYNFTYNKVKDDFDFDINMKKFSNDDDFNKWASKKTGKTVDEVSGMDEPALRDALKGAHEQRAASSTVMDRAGYHKLPQAAAGVGTTAWLVSKMSESKGQMSNAQLYGQQAQPY